MIKQVEAYLKLHEYYPKLVQVDKIYATRENRKQLKDRNIRITATPLDIPVEKQKETSHQKRKKRLLNEITSKANFVKRKQGTTSME